MEIVELDHIQSIKKKGQEKMWGIKVVVKDKTICSTFRKAILRHAEATRGVGVYERGGCTRGDVEGVRVKEAL
jgi:hypothetical protein